MTYNSEEIKTHKNDNQESLNNEIFKIIQITSQEHILLKSLENFYQNNQNINDFLPIIKGYSCISMRLIDYFVTNYSKKYRVNYNIIDNNNSFIFNVYSSYKSQLKAYNKKYFDPFSRGNRIPFFFPNDCIITTIGQLNFFKWFISNKIINYIRKHIDDIERELDLSKNQIKNKKKKKKIKKHKLIYNNSYSRKNISNIQPIMCQKKNPINIVVSFE